MTAPLSRDQVLLAAEGGGGGAPNFDVGWIDLSVIIGYLILSRIIPLVFSQRASKKNKEEGGDESEQYFLGGRNFLWPFVGLSLVATNMSGATFVGLAGGAYDQGISIFAYEWMSAVILVIFIFFILPFYLRSKIFTLPEFLENRFDHRSRKAFAGFNLFANMFIDMAAALYAGAILIKAIYPQVPIWVSIAALALLAAVYTVIGGLGAVMISDSIQATITIVGGALVFFFTLEAVGSFENVREAAGDRRMSLILPPGDPDLPWPGLITGVIVIGLYYWTTNQLVVQRSLGAKSLDHGRWGSLLAGFIKLAFLFLFIFPGVMALVLYPNLQNPDTVFPTLVFDLLPVGLRGLILAAVIAAITSTVDSILNSASTIVTMDFVKPIKPDISQQQLVRVGQLSTVGALVVAVVWAPTIAQFDTLYGYLQSVLSYLVPPVVAVFLLGIAIKRINATAAFSTLVIMQPLGAITFVLIEVLGVVETLPVPYPSGLLEFSTFEIPLQFLYVAGMSLTLSVALLLIISAIGETPDTSKTGELTWDNRYWTEETTRLKEQSVPVWANYRVLSVILLLCTAGLVWAYA